MAFIQPKLIHPIGIIVRPTDKENTIFDPNAREPIQIVKRNFQFEIAAQMKYREVSSEGLGVARKSHSGMIEGEAGYALIRYIDAAAKLWTPKLGDKFVRFGSNTTNPQEVQVYIRRLSPTAHYPQSGPTMVKCFFGDEKPVHNG